jgi:hypothetical protein
LFGVSPLTEHGLSATYTNEDLQITTPTPHGPKTILYGVKQPRLAFLSSEIAPCIGPQRYPARTTRRTRPLRLNYIWITDVQNILQHPRQRMAQQLSVPNREDP